MRSLGLTFLENLEAYSGSCGMIASGLLRTMAANLDVSLWLFVCISGEVLDFLSHFYAHEKLTHNTLWGTCHFHHGVFPLSCDAPRNNTESNNPCFSALEISLWEPFLHICDKQNTTQFLLLSVHLLQYAPQLHKSSTLVPPLSYQWNGCYILRHALLLAYFCFLTCFQCIASVAEPWNYFLEILSDDAIHHSALLYRLLIAMLLLDCYSSFDIFFSIFLHYIILTWCFVVLVTNTSLSSYW